MSQESTENDEKKLQRIGKYEIVTRLASGGMGAVYKARDVDLDRIVALKIMSPNVAARPGMIERFKQEGRSAAKLRHENIVSIYDIGEEKGTHFIALEFVEGIDLHDYILKKGKLDSAGALLISQQAARALDHAYQNSIVHRDVKPSNFMLTRKGRNLQVKLSDFGLARQQNDDEEGQITNPNTTLGTVDYMPPEQARSSKAADIRSDMYALGCTIFHMLTGGPPFPKGSLIERIVQHTETEAPFHKIEKFVPQAFVQIIRKLMAKKPIDRYQTPQELIRDLDALEKSGQNVAEDETSPEKESLRSDSLKIRASILEMEQALDKEKESRRPEKKSERVERLERRPEVKPDTEGKYETEYDEEIEPRESPRKKKKKPSTFEKKKKKPVSWVPFAMGGGVVLVGLLLLLLIASNSNSPPKDDDPKIVVVPPVQPPPPPPFVDKKEEKISPIPLGELAGPPLPQVKPRYQPVLPLDMKAILKDYRGPFEAFPTPPAAAQIIKVMRTPKAESGAVRSLGEALAQTPEGASIIEIHDAGPLLEPAITASLANRKIWIRPGLGFRPFLGWDVQGSGAKNTFFSLNQGMLVLENLDVFIPWPENLADQPAVLFHLPKSSFFARNCTFSVSGKNNREICLLDQEGIDQPGLMRLSNCLVRGTDLVLLHAKNCQGDLLLEDSLIANSRHPLMKFQGEENQALNLRVIRSSVFANHSFWQWIPTREKEPAPKIQSYLLDSLLGRFDLNTDGGDLFHLQGGADLKNLKWNVTNSIYLGWKTLGRAAGVTLDHLDSMHTRWSYREGDQAYPEGWSRPLPPDIGEVPATQFFTYDTPFCFSAFSGPSPLGCPIGLLPLEPADWSSLVTFPPKVPSIPLPTIDPPVIPAANDGLYYGEKIDLGSFDSGKIDLGSLLQRKLQSNKPGPQVVFFISGKGGHYSGPLRIKGIERLILYFEQPRDPMADPFTVEFRLPLPSSQKGLIEMEGGTLELIGARFRLENNRTAKLLPYFIRIQSGGLLLGKCHLQGPLSKAPDQFKSLISFEGGKDSTHQFGIKDCVLLGNKNLIRLTGMGTHLRMNNCLALSLGDVISLEPGDFNEARPNTFLVLENNSFALRKTFFALNPAVGKLPEKMEPIVVQTQNNFFQDPFTDDSKQTCILRYPAGSLPSGILLWRGKGNVFDKTRMLSFHGAVGEEAAPQTIQHWYQIWGTFGDQQFRQIELPTPPKGLNQDNPALGKLAVPPQFRLADVGADFSRLGIPPMKK